MKKLLLLATLALSATLAKPASAAQISGGIDFVGSSKLNAASLAGATGVVANGFSGVTVSVATGDFATLLGSAVTMTPSAWSFEMNAPGLTNFWSVGGFTFHLLTSTVEQQSSHFLNVSGEGTLYALGFDPTPGFWSFTTQNAAGGGVPSKIFSFSAQTVAAPSPAVPDGGTTAMLLGLAVVALGTFTRRKRA